MKYQTRAYRETQDDGLWSAVWSIWPSAMMFEEQTPFNVPSRSRIRSVLGRNGFRKRKHGGVGEAARHGHA